MEGNYNEILMSLLRTSDHLWFMADNSNNALLSKAYILGASIALEMSPHQLEIELESLAERTVL